MENKLSTNTLKAVMYVRVSSKEQEKEGFSIPAQKKFLEEYAYKKNFKVVKTFEEAETAKKAGRKEFLKMLEYLNMNNDVKHILVEKTDRLYRNFKDYSLLDFESMNLTIHWVKEGEILSKDSKSHQKFIHGIRVVMAKNYIDNLSEEVKKGQTEKASQGTWPSMAPIGYLNKLEGHTIIVNPQTGPIIKRAFEMASTGQYSLLKLKKELFRFGLRSARSKKELGKEAMSRILKNCFYHGDFIWNQKKYKGTHEPLITKELFNRVQEIMGFVQKSKLSKHKFTYTGLISCFHCGCAITAEKKTKKSGRTYIYYHCTNGKDQCSKVSYLREDKIELYFIGALEKIKLTPEIIDWTREALLESFKDEKDFRENSLKILNERYNKLDSYISKAYEDHLEGHITNEFWQTKTSGWKDEQERVALEINSLRQANTNYMLEGVRLMELAGRASQLFLSMDSDEKKEILKLVLSNLTIKDGSVEYDYKKPFSMFVNLVDIEKWRERGDLNPRPSA